MQNHPDHLGSSSYITNLDGEITQHMEYLPFGETLVEEHLNSNNSPYKFNAKELDAETGNYYYGARYYDPKFSIWLSVDPLAEEYPGWSPYNYTMNNPINFIDPDGRMAISVNGPPGDYYDTEGNYLGNDGIDDNMVYTVEGTSRFNITDFQEGGKYHNNQIAYNENNGSGYSVNAEGTVSDVFVTGDAPSDTRIQELHPAIRMKATDFINSANESSCGTLIRVAQGLRTFAEQDALYAKGRTAPGNIVTNARGGFSNHNFGLAFDIVGITDGAVDYNLNWSNLSELGSSYGFDWGGNWSTFTDRPHFQNLFGESVQSLRQKYNSGDLVNDYVKIK